MPENPTDEFNYNPLLQRFFLSPEQKASKEKGKAIIKAIYAAQTGNTTNLNYFTARNARWINLLLWAKGSQPMQQFLDYMSVTDGNKAWVNIDLTQTRIAAQFVGTLVESMAKNKTYPCVNAVDDGSLSEKEQRLYDALFRMQEVETIDDVQKETGVQLEPSNAFVPNDEMSAKVYFELEDRLPKEIRFEKMLSCLKDTINFERILNRKSIYDLTVLNCGVTKIDKLAPKSYTVRKCIPTNMTFNFFMNDNGDCEITQIGEFYNLKVKDFRARFGKTTERPNGLTEKEIFDLAKLSSTKNIGTFNYMWQDQLASTTYYLTRPYDDSSILVYDCEVNFEEEQYYTSKKDANGKVNIQAKKGVPYQQTKKDGTVIEQPKPEDTEVIKTNKNTWMRGVYAPYGDTMLYWGVPDIIITPYTNVAKPLSSYTIIIPNNDGEYVPSLFERIVEPLREYQLTKLKRKQLIAQVRPAGIRIDVESARNIDLGNGDSISWEEVLRIFNQTGTEVWSSKGVDPLKQEAPAITNTSADDSVRKIMELTNVLAGIVSEIRQLIGVPQYRDGSDVGDRTSGVLQEQQNIASYNVSDFVLNANNQLWEETFYKVCLLHWNDIVKEEPESKNDMINTRFEVTVKMKSTEYEKEQLERDIAQYSQIPDANGNPSLSLKDAMTIREIDNPKLARWYLSTIYEENRQNAIAEKERLAAENAKYQQESNDQAANKAIQLQKDKIKYDEKMKELEGRNKKEEILLEKGLDIWKTLLTPQKGADGQTSLPKAELPPELKGLLDMTFQSVAQSLSIEINKTQEQIEEEKLEKEQLMKAAAEQQQMQQQVA
jgi:hypothetical protein